MADGATPNTYREMPHNIEAEQALLGAIFVWNEAYHRVADVIGPEHFFDPLHAEIFAHMGVVIGELRRHCTPVTMAPFFETAPPIDKSLTVPQYLGRIAAGAITIINAVDYAKTIRDLAVRRQLVRLGTDLVNSAYDAPIDFPPAEQIVAAEQALYELAERGPRDDLEVDFGVAADRAVEQVNAAYERGGGLLGLSTGLRAANSLDDKLGGLAPTDLIILGGRPGMGKTALATTIGFYNAYEAMLTRERERKSGCYVHFFSQEMSASQLAIRTLAGLADIDSERLRRGAVNEDEIRRLMREAARMKTLPMRVDETGGLTLAQLASKARRTKRERGTGLIIIDYLQLMDDQSRENRTQGLTYLTKGLKALAKELAVPIIVLSQLNRKVEERNDKRPQLADLRESGSIEQDADIVMFCYREEYYLEREVPPASEPDKVTEHAARLAQAQGRAEIILAKHRHAPTGIVHCGFDNARTRFFDLAQEHPAMGGR
jgi:replicative DNA helicase